MKAGPRGSSPMTARTLGTCTQTNGATSKCGGVAPSTAFPELSVVRSSRMTRTSPGRAPSLASPRRQETLAPIFRSRDRASSRATASTPTPTPVGSIQTRRRAEEGASGAAAGGGTRDPRALSTSMGPALPPRRLPRSKRASRRRPRRRVDTGPSLRPPAGHRAGRPLSCAWSLRAWTCAGCARLPELRGGEGEDGMSRELAPRQRIAGRGEEPARAASPEGPARARRRHARESTRVNGLQRDERRRGATSRR